MAQMMKTKDTKEEDSEMKMRGISFIPLLCLSCVRIIQDPNLSGFDLQYLCSCTDNRKRRPEGEDVDGQTSRGALSGE
jgi:hypothetical protein